MSSSPIRYSTHMRLETPLSAGRPSVNAPKCWGSARPRGAAHRTAGRSACPVAIYNGSYDGSGSELFTINSRSGRYMWYRPVWAGLCDVEDPSSIHIKPTTPSPTVCAYWANGCKAGYSLGRSSLLAGYVLGQSRLINNSLFLLEPYLNGEPRAGSGGTFECYVGTGTVPGSYGLRR